MYYVVDKGVAELPKPAFTVRNGSVEPAYNRYTCITCAQPIQQDDPTYFTYSSDDIVCWQCLGTKLSEPGPILPPCYLTRAEAHAQCDPKTQDVLFVPSPETLDAWHTREQQRFDNHTYRPVPWAQSQHSALAYVHYVHMSTDKPGMIAFTRDIEAGILDKQTRMKPGRYLQEFYADRFDTDQIADYVRQCAAIADSKLQLAVTAEDITRIYNVASGPDSCMRRKSRPEYDWQKLLDSGELPCHPCAVYAPHLAVAYMGTFDAVSQRAVVWPAKKLYTRVYGSGCLEDILVCEGYRHTACMTGALLRAVPFHDGYVVPYFDGTTRGFLTTIDSVQWIEVGTRTSPRDFDILLDRVSGYSGDDEIETEADSDNDNYCAACNDYFPDDDFDFDFARCIGCAQNRWTCAVCGDVFYHDDNQQEVYHDRLVCDNCSEDLPECAAQSCDNRWIERTEFSLTRRREREATHLNDVCPECEASFSLCAECDRIFDTREATRCPHCPGASSDDSTQPPLPFVAPPITSKWWANQSTAVVASGPVATPTVNPTLPVVPVPANVPGSGHTLSFSDAIRESVWAIAGSDSSPDAQCHVCGCHAPLQPGMLVRYYSSDSRCFAYCRMCMVEAGVALPPTSAFPREHWYRVRDRNTVNNRGLENTVWYESLLGHKFYTHGPAFTDWATAYWDGDLGESSTYEEIPAPTTNRPPTPTVPPLTLEEVAHASL